MTINPTGSKHMVAMIHPSPPKRPAAYMDEYGELCAAFPLVPLRTRAELRAAEKVMDRLAVVDEDRATPAQEDYLFVLTQLYAAAERRLFADELAELEASLEAITGVDVLRFLLDRRGMSGGDLGRLLGNRQMGNAILRGDRQLSKEHVRVLAGFFGVHADLFLAK